MTLTPVSCRDDVGRDFHRDGIILVKDLFSPEEVADLFKDICSVFEIGLGGEGGRALIGEMYQTRKEMWRACARQMQNSLALTHLAGSPAIVDLIRRLGLRHPVLCVHPEVRVDVVQDHQYMQPWHQDWRSGQGSPNSVTIWLPLHDVSASDGAIEVLLGTHTLGLLETIELQSPRRFQVAHPPLDTAPPVLAELRQGHCAVFSQMLVHRSGINRGSLPRLTCQLRYADLTDERFKENLYRAPQGSELVWSMPPSAGELTRWHSAAAAAK